jgi:hypothetical protein
MARPLRRDDYTVGWVCALPVELAAAQEMLDEEHPDLAHDAIDNDENLYALGSIGGHNVVIVCLPAGRIGNNPAAAVATQMPNGGHWRRRAKRRSRRAARRCCGQPAARKAQWGGAVRRGQDDAERMRANGVAQLSTTDTASSSCASACERAARPKQAV